MHRTAATGTARTTAARARAVGGLAGTRGPAGRWHAGTSSCALTTSVTAGVVPTALINGPSRSGSSGSRARSSGPRARGRLQLFQPVHHVGAGRHDRSRHRLASHGATGPPLRRILLWGAGRRSAGTGGTRLHGRTRRRGPRRRSAGLRASLRRATSGSGCRRGRSDKDSGRRQRARHRRARHRRAGLSRRLRPRSARHSRSRRYQGLPGAGEDLTGPGRRNGLRRTRGSNWQCGDLRCDGLGLSGRSGRNWRRKRTA